MEKTKPIVLRDIKKEGEENRWHYLSVELKENGNLFLDACDVTPVAKDFFGNSEYEYNITVKNKDLVQLRKAFDIPDRKDIIDYLVENFSGEKSFKFEKLLKERNVPNEFDVW